MMKMAAFDNRAGGGGVGGGGVRSRGDTLGLVANIAAPCSPSRNANYLRVTQLSATCGRAELAGGGGQS